MGRPDERSITQAAKPPRTGKRVTMQITVNGENRDFEAGATLAALVASFSLNPKHVAVEINEDLVPRRLYDTTALRDGDRIEIVTLVGGG